MENLNAEQIKEDIDNCIEGECELCSYYDQTACKEHLMHGALALINSQEQDKEKLRLLISEIEKEKQKLFDENKRLIEENEKLRAKIVEEDKLLNDRVIESVNAVSKAHKKYSDFLEEELKTVKADTVRKVADLLWEGESEKLNISVGGKYYDKQEFIDQIAKEMNVSII